MMRKFEYKQEKVLPDTLKQLNDEGKNGWELVMQASDIQPNRLGLTAQPTVTLVFIFKRKIGILSLLLKKIRSHENLQQNAQDQRSLAVS